MDDCDSLDLSVGEADVHIARDGQISFTPKTTPKPKSRLFVDPEDREEDEDEEEDEEDDLVPYNSFAVLAALQSLQEKIRALEAERDFYKEANSKNNDSSDQHTSKDEEISLLRQRIRNVRMERDDWQRKSKEMKSLLEKQKRNERVSRKKSKIKIELEIVRDRLEESETSRKKLELKCRELESENKILRLGNVKRKDSEMNRT